jgi:hypothetical protein
VALEQRGQLRAIDRSSARGIVIHDDRSLRGVSRSSVTGAVQLPVIVRGIPHDHMRGRHSTLPVGGM